MARNISIFMVLCMALASLHAATTTWTAGSGSWGTAGNWDNGTPVDGDDAFFDHRIAAVVTDVSAITTLNTLNFTNPVQQPAALKGSPNFLTPASILVTLNGSEIKINDAISHDAGTTVLNLDVAFQSIDSRVNVGDGSGSGNLTINGDLTLTSDDNNGARVFVMASGFETQAFTVNGTTTFDRTSGTEKFWSARLEAYSSGGSATVTHNGDVVLADDVLSLGFGADADTVGGTATLTVNGAITGPGIAENIVIRNASDNQGSTVYLNHGQNTITANVLNVSDGDGGGKNLTLILDDIGYTGPQLQGTGNVPTPSTPTTNNIPNISIIDIHSGYQPPAGRRPGTRCRRYAPDALYRFNRCRQLRSVYRRP